MANKDFVVKNGIVVDTSFSANSTSIRLGLGTSSNLVINTSIISITGNQIANSLGANYAFSSNNSSYLGTVAAASYQLNSTLAANVAVLTANNANNLGGVAPTSYVNTAGSYTLSGNLTFSGANLSVSGTNSYFTSNVTITGTTSSISSNLSVSSIVSMTNTTAASSTTTGALKVSGGVGIGGSLYAAVITSSGDVTAFSDRRLKTEIKTIEDALEKVKRLRGVNFTKDDKYSIGVIAQEVQDIIPEVVNTDGEYLSVAYGNLVGLLIEAIKELSAKVDRLENN